MSSPLERLYKTQLALLATVLTVVGIALMVLARWATSHAAGSWLTDLPVLDVGSSLFTAGLLGIFLDYLRQRDNELRTNEMLRQIIKDEAPAIRDAVVDGFAFAPKSLTNVASPDTLDRIVENTLSIRLGDQELAADAYRDLRQQVIGARQRWYDAHVSVGLAPWSNGPAFGKGSMFVATVKWEYRFTPASPVLRFSCVSDEAIFRELSSDPASTAVWYFQPIQGLTAASREVYELVQVTVDGKPLTARRGERKESQTYSVNMGESALGQEVTLSFTYRVLVQKNSHLLHLDISQPTNNFSAELWYSPDCGIRKVNTLDYLSGPRQPRLTETQPTDPSPSVSVAYDSWTFPKGGVAFVWVLEAELETASQ